ncbi:Hsp20/alpha crystallin family protein [Paeniglutamicibacter psychrophenolicus]|uniref:Hsp20/alpha crystallin family protein n=1 Tax=Paeniglutamicibacter psychrophenolicus TaxID=257454 RepID=UPI00278A100D|nr:Hsp20/alpha crystallin family protein [Paeniglutamicibacter psychrophenolicus]MDQ0092494.1 HSP20 family protein [Paeniglutamicibacter psychrophenolicus]
MNEILSWSPRESAASSSPFDLLSKSPFGMLDSLQRLFDGEDEKTTMRVEEFVEDNTLVVRAELPGIDPDKDVEVSVADGVLSISARREDTSETRSEGRYRSEFRYGSMLRRIALPEGVGESEIKASYKDGILEVRSPMPAQKSAPETTKVAITRD